MINETFWVKWSYAIYEQVDNVKKDLIKKHGVDPQVANSMALNCCTVACTKVVLDMVEQTSGYTPSDHEVSSFITDAKSSVMKALFKMSTIHFPKFSPMIIKVETEEEKPKDTKDNGPDNTLEGWADIILNRK